MINSIRFSVSLAKADRGDRGNTSRGVAPVENDGILTAEDVSTLDLQGTWLVTLSACDTGFGGSASRRRRHGFCEEALSKLARRTC